MENIQNLMQSALLSIGAAQAIAIALAAGFIMKESSQIAIFTLCALAADRLVAIGRNAVDGQPVDRLVKANWHDFMTLPMGTFLAASISFGLIVFVAFNIKAMLKKL